MTKPEKNHTLEMSIVPAGTISPPLIDISDNPSTTKRIFCTIKIIKLAVVFFILLIFTTYYFIAKSHTQDRVIKFCETAFYIKQYDKIVELLPKETSLTTITINDKSDNIHIIYRSKVIPANPIYNPIYRCVLSFNEEGVLRRNLVHKMEFKIWAD